MSKRLLRFSTVECRSTMMIIHVHLISDDKFIDYAQSLKTYQKIHSSTNEERLALSPLGPIKGKNGEYSREAKQ